MSGHQWSCRLHLFVLCCVAFVVFVVLCLLCCVVLCFVVLLADTIIGPGEYCKMCV